MSDYISPYQAVSGGMEHVESLGFGTNCRIRDLISFLFLSVFSKLH